MEQDPPGGIITEGDSDWAGSEDARSPQCTVLMFGHHCLEVLTSNQTTVATASAIAELLALNRAAGTSILARNILKEMQVVVIAVADTDSSAAKGISQRVGSGRVRHLRIQDLWIQEWLRKKDVEVRKLDTETNRGDIGTKFVEPTRITALLRLMGLTTRGQEVKALKPTSKSGAALRATTLAALFAPGEAIEVRVLTVEPAAPAGVSAAAAAVVAVLVLAVSMA